MNDLICPKCGNNIDLKDVFKDVLEDAVNERTTILTKQLESLTNLVKQYMDEAGEAKARALELETKLSAIDKEIELKVYEQAMAEVSKVKEQMAIESELKVKEKLDTIRQLKEQLALAQQKAEQGSMQQQGEVQELYIEEYLISTFPLDTIEEVKKGFSGADVVQIINTRNKLNLGKIYYESKRTKKFNYAWVDKLKQDMLRNGADVGVIVSSARPSGKNKASKIKGIWVCSVDEFKIVSKLLRESIIKLDEHTFFQENRQDKKELIYAYVTGPEFKLQIESIIEGFSKLQEDLQSEKRAMQTVWKTREKHIQMVIDSTIGLYGSIKGLGGDTIDTVKSLELLNE